MMRFYDQQHRFYGGVDLHARTISLHILDAHGRTPVAELPQLSGRDHNHYGFTCWLAGGGVKGGQTYGSTDEFGFAAADKPVHVHDLHATMLQLLGFDHTRLTYRYAGRDFRLTDVHGNVVEEMIA